MLTKASFKTMQSRRPWKRAERRGVAEVIAILMLVLIVLATVIFVLIFGTGIIHDLIAGGVSTPITGSGQMTVPGSAGQNAILDLTIRNNQGVSITGVVVTCPSAFAIASNCVTMTYDNNPITPALSDPPGTTIVGSAEVSASSGSQFTAGTVYALLVTVNFATGRTVTFTVSVMAVS